MQLYLYSNPGLIGTIPASLGKLNSVTFLDLDSNLRLTGTIPASIAGCTNLTEFLAFRTGLSGQLPTFPRNLGKLLVHDCQLSGTLPSFRNMTSLQQLSVFGNRFGGRLALPPQTDTMPLLLAHNNNLSCEV